MNFEPDPPDDEGDEYLLERRARYRRPTMDENEKETLPRIETPPPPAVPPDPIMQYFVYEHLPPHLAKVSAPFCLLAATITDQVTGLPRNPERTVCLRKLLEAKDAAVRAALTK